MKKKIYKEPEAAAKQESNTVIFKGNKYTVVARSMNSVRIARPGEEIIVAADRVQPIEAKQEDPEE